MELIVGRRFGLILLIGFFIVYYIYMLRGKKGIVQYVRMVPALAAIEEAVGRAAETGRPVFACPGQYGFTGIYSAVTLAGVAIVNYTAGLCARYEIPIIILENNNVVFAYLQDSVKEQFRLQGKPEAYRDEFVRYIPYGMAFDLTVMSIAEREKPAAAIMVGYWWHAILYSIENMNQAGAITIGGTQGLSSYIIGGCDYALLGDELTNSEAILSKDPIGLGAVAAIDWMKFLNIALLVLGTILVTFGSDIVQTILGY